MSKIYIEDCISALEKIEKNSVASCIADPPYFKVLGGKGSWDYKWKTEDEYLAWCNAWFRHVYRVLKGNGHFWLWGYYDILARCHDLLIKLGFRHRQTIIWDKGIQAVAGRATKNYQMYPNVTELCVNYIKWNRDSIASILKERQKELKLSSKEINEAIGCKSNGGGMWSIYTGRNLCEQIPTKDRWEKLMAVLKLNIPYAEVELVWNTIPSVTNVWSDIKPVEKSKRIHIAQKPEKAIERLVLTTTNEGDTVLDMFAGSFTTSVVCEKLNREYIAIEADVGQILDNIDKIDSENIREQILKR